MLLDFFQFYSASEEGDAVDSEANDESMNKKNDTNSTTRFDLLHQLASNEGVSVNVLFPTIVYRKSNEMTADYDVHHEGRFNEKILTYPTFDEVIRYSTLISYY